MFGMTGPYAGALLMSLGALCLFVWGVLSGALGDADRTAQRFFEREMEHDDRARRPNRRG